MDLACLAPYCPWRSQPQQREAACVDWIAADRPYPACRASVWRGLEGSLCAGMGECMGECMGEWRALFSLRSSLAVEGGNKGKGRGYEEGWRMWRWW